jgi:hypothetical protein
LQQLLDLSLPFLAAAYQKEKVIPHKTKPRRREKNTLIKYALQHQQLAKQIQFKLNHNKKNLK